MQLGDVGVMERDGHQSEFHHKIADCVESKAWF